MLMLNSDYKQIVIPSMNQTDILTIILFTRIATEVLVISFEIIVT